MFGNSNNDEIVNINDLVGVHDRRKQTRAEIYETLFKKCWDRIKRLNNRFYVTEFVYEVPTVQWGYPLYSVHTCVCYIMVKLRKEKFNVRYVPPNSVYISWKQALSVAKPSSNTREDVKEYDDISNPRKRRSHYNDDPSRSSHSDRSRDRRSSDRSHSRSHSHSDRSDSRSDSRSDHSHSDYRRKKELDYYKHEKKAIVKYNPVDSKRKKKQLAIQDIINER